MVNGDYEKNMYFLSKRCTVNLKRNDFIEIVLNGHCFHHPESKIFLQKPQIEVIKHAPPRTTDHSLQTK